MRDEPYDAEMVTGGGGRAGQLRDGRATGSAKREHTVHRGHSKDNGRRGRERGEGKWKRVREEGEKN